MSAFACPKTLTANLIHKQNFYSAFKKHRSHICNAKVKNWNDKKSIAGLPGCCKIHKIIQNTSKLSL